MSKLRSIVLTCCLGLGVPSGFGASISGFGETTLVTSASDPDLVNSWGITSSATSPFWISNNGTGTSTLYSTAGVKQGLVVSMPAGSEPITGLVFNGTASFNGDTFLFASENGTVAGWRAALGTTAEPVFSQTGAIYKGLAISNAKDVLFAANFAAGTIDVFSGSSRIGAFSDPTVPAGYAPFNVQNVGGRIFVTFALREGMDDVPGAGHGFVDIFDPVSQTFTRAISQGALNSPWGLTLAPSGFGAVGGDLLVGNFGDGLINAYAAASFNLVGSLGSSSANPLVNEGLWGLIVGNGGNGGLANSVYITAGPDDEQGGMFARIDAVPEPSTTFLFCSGLLVLGIVYLRSAVRREQA